MLSYNIFYITIVRALNPYNTIRRKDTNNCANMQSEVKKVRLARLERFLPHELLITHAPPILLAKAVLPLGRAPPSPHSPPWVYRLITNQLLKKLYTPKALRYVPIAILHLPFGSLMREAPNTRKAYDKYQRLSATTSQQRETTHCVPVPNNFSIVRL